MLTALDPWGNEGKQKREDAKEWLTRWARDVLPPARSDLGLRFIGGKGYGDDPFEAVKWWHYDAMHGRGP